MFLAAGLSVWRRQAWWPSFAFGVTLFSLVLCVLGWPDSRIGVAVNVAILVLLALGVRLGWLASA